jgi:hypothetical protein
MNFKTIPWHPVFLGMFYILSIYQTTMEHHPVQVIWIPLFASILFVCGIALLGALLFRSFRAGALLASSLIVILLIVPFLRDRIRDLTNIDAGMYVFMALLIVFVAGLYALGKERRNSAKGATVVNLVGICCLVSPVLSIFSAQAGLGDDNPLVSDEGIEGKLSAAKMDRAPDIYHIVLDGYARNDTQQRLYSYDNAEFLGWLRRSGFYVADKASANYCQTGLSLAASMNGHYLELPEEFAATNNRKILKDAFQRSSVPTFLRNAGYGLRLYDSGYYLTDSLAGAERIETSPSNWNEFMLEVIRRSVAGLPENPREDFLVSFSGKTLGRKHRTQVVTALDLLGQETPTENPTYTFIHVVAPHPPFIFADAGLRQTPPSPYSITDGSHRVLHLEGGADEYQRLYVDQLKAVNQMVEDAVGQLLANYKDQPLIVILQSDHGPGSLLDWEDVCKSDADERLAILTALYYSNADYSNLYEGITPINLWRVILNDFFMDDPLPLLEDQSYLSSWPRPYVFYEKE